MIGRFAGDARWRFPGCRASRMSSTWRLTTAEFGRRPTSDAPGIRSLMLNLITTDLVMTSLMTTTVRFDWSAGRRALESEHDLCRQRRRLAPSRPFRRQRHLQVDRRGPHLAASGQRDGALRDAEQIGSILVDPKDANRVFVAALGHPYGPNSERGVYRSLDGGATWQKFSIKTTTPARLTWRSIRETRR